MQVSSYLFQSPYPQSVQMGRPDPVQEQKQASEEQAAKSKESETDKQSAQSKKEPTAVEIKSSAMYQNDNSFKDTAQAVNAFINIAKDVQRSENINTYATAEKA